MSEIKAKVTDKDGIFKEVYESTPLPYFGDEGDSTSVAIDVDDSVVGHSPIATVIDEPVTYTVITQRARSGGLDYDPDDYADFFVPGQSPVYTPNSSSGNFDYSSPNSVYSLNNTDSSVRSGGRGVSSKVSEGNRSHVVDRGNDYITRDIKNTKATAVKLYECIKVVPGNVSGGTSSTSVSGGAKGGYVQIAGNRFQGGRVKYGVLTYFDVSSTGTYNIDFNHASYLRVAGQNFARGKGIYNLEKFDGNKLGGVVKTLLSTTQNVGVRTNINHLGNYHEGSKSLSVPVTLTPGRYAFVIRVEDLYTDMDKDDEGYMFYAWASVDVRKKSTSTAKDSTYATAELINLANGSVIQSQKVTDGQCFNYSVPKGSHYRVRYTLHRGNGKTGGLNGNGGSLYAYNGSISQDWQEYSFNDPKEEFPYTPPAPFEPPFSGDVEVGGSGGGATVPAPSVYCWLDVFRLYSAPIVEPEPDCFGNDVTVTIYENGRFMDDYVFDDSDTYIKFNITNNSSSTKTYDITFDYDHDCDGDPPIHLYGGKFIFDETREPDESRVSINGFYAEQEKDIWYGAEGSNLKFNVYDGSGSLIKTYTWDRSGTGTFDVTNLGHLPYPNYRAEFITTQCGSVSPVTNIDYRAEFIVDEFKAHETWKPEPLPFGSVLEFYIDDVLVGRWDREGGGVFKKKVPKGNHTYKWVFTNKNLENTWDYAEIDWFRLTNWICDAIVITPYCEPGRGDEAIEALLKCLLEIWRQRPEGCVFGNKKIWLFT